MPYGRIKTLASVAGETVVGPPPPTAVRSWPNRRAPRGEVERLRLINEHLVNEVLALREREAHAQQLADRDALTGLYNRRRVLELLESSLAMAARKGRSVGLLFIDLNGFKGINDEYGHAAGDEILTTLANRIAGCVRTGDIVGRYGGDEFLVILPEIPDRTAVSHVADKIRDRVALPYRVAGTEQHLTAAVGESIYPEDGATGDVLLKQADQAMYRLKAHLSRPLVSIGSVAPPLPARRRNDGSQTG